MYAASAVQARGVGSPGPNIPASEELRLSDVTIGGLMLNAPATWTFSEVDELVVGRTEARLGSLQIRTASRRSVRPDATSADCMARLEAWLASKTPLTVARHHGGIGIVELSGIEGVGRAWWNLSPGGLLLASYRSRGHAWTPVTKAERDAAEAIVVSARWFDA
jgi:hypothetical protein